jgi:hypothetical protein
MVTTHHLTSLCRICRTCDNILLSLSTAPIRRNGYVTDNMTTVKWSVSTGHDARSRLHTVLSYTLRIENHYVLIRRHTSDSVASPTYPPAVGSCPARPSPISESGITKVLRDIMTFPKCVQQLRIVNDFGFKKSLVIRICSIG